MGQLFRKIRSVEKEIYTMYIVHIRMDGCFCFTEIQQRKSNLPSLITVKRMNIGDIHD